MSGMERTPLREEFFRLAMEDPYLAQIRKMYVHAWVEGYRRALDDVLAIHFCAPYDTHLVEELRYSKSYRDREEDALAYVTATERQAEELVSLALLGGKIERAQPHLIGPMGDVSQARYCYCGHPESHV